MNRNPIIRLVLSAAAFAIIAMLARYYHRQPTPNDLKDAVASVKRVWHDDLTMNARAKSRHSAAAAGVSGSGSAASTTGRADAAQTASAENSSVSPSVASDGRVWLLLAGLQNGSGSGGSAAAAPPVAPSVSGPGSDSDNDDPDGPQPTTKKHRDQDDDRREGDHDRDDGARRPHRRRLHRHRHHCEKPAGSVDRESAHAMELRRRTGASLEEISELRESGLSWDDVSRSFRAASRGEGRVGRLAGTFHGRGCKNPSGAAVLTHRLPGVATLHARIDRDHFER